MTAQTVLEVLASERGRAAVQVGNAGELIRLVRSALGVRQADLGAAIGYSQPTISKLEKGRGRISDKTVLAAIARQLGIPPVALGLAGDPFDDETAVPTLADMKRQDFVRGLIGATATLALPAFLTEAAPRVGAADVAACRQALERLYAIDGQIGGGHVYAINTEMIARLRALQRNASYAAATGRQLRELVAAACEHAGWSAFDAGRHNEARRWWLEALHDADVGEHTPVRTIALASMSLQAADQQHGRESVDLAQAAARGDQAATPRVRSLLAAREALGHATAGDKATAGRMFARSARLLDHGPRPDEPSWCTFWGPADLAHHEARAAIMLGDWPRAEQISRGLFESMGNLARNNALYALRLGIVLARRRAVDEAISVVTPTVAASGQLASGRVRAEMRSAVNLIAHHRDHRPAREFVAWAAGATA